MGRNSRGYNNEGSVLMGLMGIIGEIFRCQKLPPKIFKTSG